MKANLLLLAPFTLVISACDPTGASMSGSGIDPLRPPSGVVDEVSYSSEFRPGEFVSAAVNNTAFYKTKPKENQDADKLLTQGTPMKVVDLSGSYTKVELDSGEVGFVPTVMLTTGAAEIAPLDGSVEVTPPVLPVDGSVPLPADPGVVPPSVEPPVPVVPLPPQ